VGDQGAVVSNLGHEDEPESKVQGAHNDLSGTVWGPALQIGQVSGNVTVGDAAARVVMVPHEVPASLPGLVDREAERRRVRELLTPETRGVVRIAVLTGLPGVGKSTTARQVVEETAGGFAGGELYVDFAQLRDDSGTAVSTGLADCLHALGVNHAVMPPTLTGRQNQFRTCTNNKAVLVVLDDVVEAAEVAPFVPQAPGSVVLVTSDSRLSELVLEEAAMVPIEPLNEPAARELLTAVCGQHRAEAEPEAVGEVLGLCEGLPAALRVAGARLRGHPSLSVAELVAEITAEDSGLKAFDYPEKREKRGEVSRVFTACYRHLPVAAACLYRWLGWLPVQDFTGELVAALGGEGEAAEQRRLLGLLVEANLVRDDGAGRYRLHSLARRHARGCAEEDEPEDSRAQVSERVVEFFLRRAAFADRAVLGEGRLRIGSHEQLISQLPDPFDGEPAAALDWLDAERSNLLATARIAVKERWYRETWQLVEAMTALYVNRRYLEDWIEATRLAVTAARLDEAPKARARLQSFVSRAFTDLGDLDSAWAELEESLPIAQESADRRLEASVWELIGRWHDAHARTQEDQAPSRSRAVEAYHRALELFTEEGDQRGYAFVLYFLGQSLHAAGSDEALPTLQRARTLIHMVGDQRMEGRALASIGTAHASCGEHTLAAATLREAIDILSAGEHVYYEAQACEALATVAESLGDRELQRENLRRALEIHVRLGSPRIEELHAALARLA
jgi:tetratricopeptide (TPR) repeat protein